MASGTGVLAHDQSAVSEADALFAAVDQVPIGDGVDRWKASVLRIHADDRYWWVDVAMSSDASVSVILQLSRRARPVHVVAALRAWQPGASCRPHVLKVMCRC